MSYDFPSSPTEDQEYTPAGGVSYVYKAPRWTVKPVAYALLASPTFTGDPKAPTPTAGDNDTSIATTAFVNGAITATSFVRSVSTPLAVSAGNLSLTLDSTMRVNGSALGIANNVVLPGDVSIPATTNSISPTTGTLTVAGGLGVGGAFNISGQMMMTTPSPVWAGITFNKPASGTGCYLAIQTAGAARWSLYLGDETPESGGNAGSDFKLNSCSDAGSILSTPLNIKRSNGAMALGSTVASTSPTTGALTVAGGVGVNGSVYATGHGCRAGSAGPSSGNNFNIQWVGPAHLWIDGTDLGAISVSSDYRVKKDVADLPSTWQAVKALRPVSYTHKQFKSLVADDGIEHWGFIAHELQETLLPSAATGVKDAPDAIQSPNAFVLIAALTKALQEAMTRIELLERAAGTG